MCFILISNSPSNIFQISSWFWALEINVHFKKCLKEIHVSKLYMKCMSALPSREQYLSKSLENTALIFQILSKLSLLQSTGGDNVIKAAPLREIKPLMLRLLLSKAHGRKDF